MLKECNDAAFQADWLKKLPEEHRPANIQMEGDNKFSYDYVKGVEPTDWRTVHETAEKVLWCGEGALPVDAAGYCEYVAHKCEALELPASRILTIIEKLTVDAVAVTHVPRCHGDLTLSNTLINTRTGKVIFIDPGHPRGLPCREMDESKILQSIDGWDVVRHHLGQPLQFPKMPTDRIHWLLLFTHYVRLLHHEHPRAALSFARQRVTELLQWLS